MTMIYIYTCLFSALTIAEMKPLNINANVGENVTFTCSDWDVWLTDVKSYVKYLCESPCTKEKHIIVKAAPGEAKQKDRIYVNNTAEGLSVTFISLQTSDSNTYLCGLEKFGLDSLIKVNLHVFNAMLTGSRTNPKSVIFGCAFSFAAVLVMGLIALIFCKRRTVSSRSPTEINTVIDISAESASHAGIYETLHPSTKDHEQIYCTATECYSTVKTSTYEPSQHGSNL
ncbi:CMRF35-like molecule 1 [Thunnus albacares]|uniref:CMRF35-like molecule 1 n=1 Tax=Thunnus albacares TaxID=8236 RepID=UPI001CF6A2A9|nr:CMRF35-like molecule 1 [Thunnus albacares]